VSAPVLHVRGDALPPFLFSDAYLGRGQMLIIHIDDQDCTHIWTYVRRPDGSTEKRAEVAPGVLNCGCP